MSLSSPSLQGRHSRQDPSHGAGGAKAVVDAHHGQTGGAGGVHGQKGSDPLEGGSVSAGHRHSHDGCRTDPPDEAGQGAFHAGHHHHGVRLSQLVYRSQETMDPSHTAVDQNRRTETVGTKDSHTLISHRKISRPRRDHHDTPRALGSRAPNHNGQRSGACDLALRLHVGGRCHLARISPGQQNGSTARLGQQLTHDKSALFRRLPGRIDGLTHPLTQPSVVVNPGEAEISEGKTAQPRRGVVRVDDPSADVV